MAIDLGIVLPVIHFYDGGGFKLCYYQYAYDVGSGWSVHIVFVNRFCILIY